MSRNISILGLLVFLIVLVMPFISAVHYMIGTVNDSLDGTSANGYQILLWNPANGIDDNMTDIIGPTGNSGVNNNYSIDCELLNTPCSVNDEIKVRVLNNGSNYITETVNRSVTVASSDIMPNLTLNSPPNITLDTPINYANFSSSSIDFNCTANDLDGNLANVTLYGNWSGGWHANETKSASGTTDTINFAKSLLEGIYKWACLVKDSLFISNFADQNFTLTVDLTDPVISSVSLNLTGDICGISEQVKVNCSVTDSLTDIDKVIIEANKPLSGKVNYTAQLLSGDTYYSDISLNEIGTWSFNCLANDSAGNQVNKTAPDTIIVKNNSLSELILYSDEIIFSNLNPIENQVIDINSTVYNNGCANADNFLVGFFEEDPDVGGTQIGENQTISITSFSNNTANITWPAKIGITNIFVSVDLSDLINEENETNNKANNTIIVNSWQEFYGNVTLDKIIADQGVMNMSIWLNENSVSGNIFIADTESNVDWASLQAIGRNTTGQTTSNDFSEIDTLLDMADFNDSVSNIFTSDGNTPKLLQDFFIYQENITNVPVINSTNNTNFITGILWDMSDDSDGEYSSSDKEDIVFAAKINKTQPGKYGTYDYEIRVPVRLREYYTADSNDVFIYFDLN
ncbi:hypothetical protein BMS3Abin17_00824 [archaeon BMS3Abin17]|nr:hypothetical protein BMS3Abin17_00824 [archaeon BMS3Abin17]HDZ60082.1 hypothetical protein [Candidatus Pacearchaeota archaeon]